MKRQISSVSIHKTSLTVAFTYVLVALVSLVILMIVPTILSSLLTLSAPTFFGINWGVLMILGLAVLLPVIGGVFVYISTALVLWVYNMVSKWTGGIEINFTDSQESQQPYPPTGTDNG